MLTARETPIVEAKRREGADRARRWAAPDPTIRHDALRLAVHSSTPQAMAPVRGIDPAMRLALHEAALAAEEATILARNLTELLEDALAALSDAEPGFAGASLGTANAQPELAPISPREREVWALVAEGRSNKAIAVALFISPNTVKTHVASLLAKLNAETRAQLAAIAARSEVAPVR